MTPTIVPIGQQISGNATTDAAIAQMAALASTGGQRVVIGKNAESQDLSAQQIFVWLNAWRQKDSLTAKEQEAILNRLDNLTKTS